MIIFRKTMIALTGLFICLFLAVHLGANLILLLPERIAHELYNSYSAALGANPFIRIIAYVNYLCFIFHILCGLWLTVKNRRARAIGYGVDKKTETSTWSSQNMGLLGTALLVFLVIHLANFWFKVKFQGDDSDLYEMVISLFRNPLYVLIYSLAMLPLGLHLSHGFVSAFRSLGLFHKKYVGILNVVGTGYAWIVGIGFAVVPILVFFRTRSL